MNRFDFPCVVSTNEEHKLRSDIRKFLAEELKSGGYIPEADAWMNAASPEFSQKLGARGWLGITWPKAYGGQGLSPLLRLAVTEELLAAGAPVAAHWIAERQTGLQILKYGTDQQKKTIIPQIAAGKCYAAIGMSEPQAGSDLAAITTNAKRNKTGWVLNGRKIWSTGAHFCDYMIVLARTSPPEGRNRHAGLSQFLVPLNTDGIEIKGIKDIVGNTHFNETLFEDVNLQEDSLLGEEGNGWEQCMGELAMERSGPERYLSSFIVLSTAFEFLRDKLDPEGLAVIGQLMAHLSGLRHMSRGIARLIEDGRPANTEGALVKEMGNSFEKQVIESLRRLLANIPRTNWPPTLVILMDNAVLRMPPSTLRGGTTEILRSIIARQLGMR